MGFSRNAPPPRPAAERLTARMVGIGMLFATKPDADADIEQTLVHASALGMDEGDFRVLSVLTTWLEVHHTHLNADRLIRLTMTGTSTRVQAYWSAIAAWLGQDRRFARLIPKHRGPPADLLQVGNDFQVARRGADERFANSSLRVPQGVLRDRAVDVLAPEVLIRKHAGYRNRVLMGPTWRADVWTVLEAAPELSVSDVARRATCSFATAWQVSQDFKLLHGHIGIASPPKLATRKKLEA